VSFRWASYASNASAAVEPEARQGGLATSFGADIVLPDLLVALRSTM
jgi:hypothetical protein